MSAQHSTPHPFAALAIALIAMGGPLVGMAIVGLTAPACSDLINGVAHPLLALGLVLVGGSAVGLALLPSFFLCAVCGYLLPGPWPYIATILGLAWATALGLGLGRLFSTNFFDVLLHRKKDWWDTYQRLIHATGTFLPTAIALLRLSPQMPFALTNLVCSQLPLTSIRIWLFSYIGLLPRTILATYVGSQLQDWRALLDRERPPWELLLSLVLLILFVSFARRVARRFEETEG